MQSESKQICVRSPSLNCTPLCIFFLLLTFVIIADNGKLKQQKDKGLKKKKNIKQNTSNILIASLSGSLPDVILEITTPFISGFVLNYHNMYQQRASLLPVVE